MNNYIEKVLFNDDLLYLIARQLNCGRSKLNQVCHSIRLPLLQTTNKLKQSKKYKILNHWNIITRFNSPKFFALIGIIVKKDKAYAFHYSEISTTTPVQWLYKGFAQTYNTVYLLGKPSDGYIDTKFFNSNLNWYKTVLKAWHDVAVKTCTEL